MESLLEMYYFKCFIESLTATYGAREFHVYKPSPQKEAWLGFDQAWAKTILPEDQFFNSIKDYNSDHDPIDHRILFAFFLQFKVVKQITHGRAMHRPEHFINPYYKISLYLHQNRTTNLSQHQCLVKLSALPNALVFYVCPILAVPIDVYSEPNINDLRLVNVTNANAYPNNSSHTINFQTPNSQPVWMSEPQEGESINFNSFARKLQHNYSGSQLIEFLELAKESLASHPNDRKKQVCDVLPNSLTIISFNTIRVKSESDPYGEEYWPPL